MSRLRRDAFAATVVASFAAASLLLAAVFVASRVLDRPIGYFTEDPAELLEVPAYTGFLTFVGAILLAAAATSCLLAWLATEPTARSPLLWSGVLLAAILVDDLFVLREYYYPTIGISQGLASAAYAVAGAAYLWLFRDFIRAHDAWLFLLGLALLGVSVITDQLLGHDAPFVLEDGAKLLGIVSWLLFYAAAALRELTNRTRPNADRHLAT